MRAKDILTRDNHGAVLSRSDGILALEERRWAPGSILVSRHGVLIVHEAGQVVVPAAAGGGGGADERGDRARLDDVAAAVVVLGHEGVVSGVHIATGGTRGGGQGSRGGFEGGGGLGLGRSAAQHLVERIRSRLRDGSGGMR